MDMICCMQYRDLDRESLFTTSDNYPVNRRLIFWIATSLDVRELP